VIDEFREGRFDYVELASDVAETKFFQFLFGQQVVDRLRPPDLRDFDVEPSSAFRPHRRSSR